MPYRLSLRSMDRARHVDPRLMAVTVLAIDRCLIDFGITEEQSRAHAEQAEKVRRGVSKTMNSKHMIPQGQSFSTAIDLVHYVDGVFQWGDNQWRVHPRSGPPVDVFYEIAAAMRSAAIAAGFRIRWGGVWDRVLNDLPAGPAAMKAAVEAYKVRHAGPDFLDVPHFELMS